MYIFISDFNHENCTTVKTIIHVGTHFKTVQIIYTNILSELITTSSTLQYIKLLDLLVSCETS